VVHDRENGVRLYLVCRDIQKRDWKQKQIIGTGGAPKRTGSNENQDLRVSAVEQLAENHETGGSLLGELGALPRDLVNRDNASLVSTGRVDCGGLVTPPTPGGEE